MNMAEPSPTDEGRPTSLLEQKNMDDKELSKLRNAMLEREGLIVSIFELLRTVPK
jgi:aarF domain-containing kinase